MRRFGAALILALSIVITAAGASSKAFADSELWQDTNRGEALRRMISAAEKVCLPAGRQRKPSEQVPELEKEFIETVRPLIRSTLAGVYGTDIPFWLEKVTCVQSLKKYPNDILRAVVEVQTYEGAHNPYGIDTIEYQLVPGPHLYVSKVKHRKHPDARF